MRVSKEFYQSTKEQLIAAPLPLETSTYKPVSHLQVMDMAQDGITKAGLVIKREYYTSAAEGNIATGRYVIDSGDSEMKLQILWQNSYNKKIPLVFGIGADVIVCTNLMIAFRSIHSFRKKHTGSIQTFAPSMIPEYIKGAGESFLGLQKDRDIMKQVPVTRRLAAELLGRLYIEKEIIEPTQLNIIVRELDNPTHKYGSPGSLWELYQFTTFAIGGIHPSRWMQDHASAHAFFLETAMSLQDMEYTEVGEEYIEESKSPFKQLDLFEDV